MPILKSVSKTKATNGKLVGMMFPEELHSYFSLYAVAMGVTKTMIVKSQMQSWYEENSKKMTEDVLIHKIVTKAKSQWKSIKAKRPEKTLPDFKYDLKDELTRRGLKEEYIQQILQGI